MTDSLATQSPTAGRKDDADTNQRETGPVCGVPANRVISYIGRFPAPRRHKEGNDNESAGFPYPMVLQPAIEGGVPFAQGSTIGEQVCTGYTLRFYDEMSSTMQKDYLRRMQKRANAVKERHFDQGLPTFGDRFRQVAQDADFKPVPGSAWQEHVAAGRRFTPQSMLRAQLASKRKEPELPLERALALQAELLAGFQDWEVCAELDALRKKYKERPTECAGALKQLVEIVETGVILKYGFEASRSGVAQMKKVFQTAPWAYNAEIQAQACDIEDMLRLDRLRVTSERAFTLQDAISLQQELIDRYSQPRFQAKLRTIEISHERDKKDFELERAQAFRAVQSMVLPKYGFSATARGFYEMQAVFDSIENQEDELHSRGRYISFLIEPLSRERGLALQNEIIVAYSQPEFQRELAVAEQKAIADLLERILPRYGFESSGSGIARMKKVFQAAPWARDAEIQSKTADIEDMLRLNQLKATSEPVFALQDALALQQELLDHYSQPGFQEKLRTIEVSYERGAKDFELERTKVVRAAQSTILPKHGFSATARGTFEMQAAFDSVEDQAALNSMGPAISDLLQPFSLERGLALQNELIVAYSRPEFQRELAVTEQKKVADLLTAVREPILPRYGFEANSRGAINMQACFFASPWNSLDQVQSNGQRIVELLNPVAIRKATSALDMATLTEQRCAKELAKDSVRWEYTCTMETLEEKHNLSLPGMIYGLEFPWNANGLKKMGPSWLTRAFHVAGTIPTNVEVIAIKNVQDFQGGGGAAKFIFDVEYKGNAEGLHTKLFVKIPFAYEGKTKSDRIQMSVNQQGGDLDEINAYRLFESRLGFRIPKYYYGDASNETTNFILITERIPFGEREGECMMDPAYKKNRDWDLKGKPEEYYYLLIRMGATLAGSYKAGRLAPPDVFHKFFSDGIKPAEMYGMTPGCSGMPEVEFKAKLKMGGEFITEVAQVLFPSYTRTESFMAKYRRILTIANAYRSEISWWQHRNPDYIAWTHINMNVDNSFFWRDSEQRLHAGVLDWGGVASLSLGRNLWWWLYGCEYEFLTEHTGTLIDTLISNYHQAGGPILDKDEIHTQFILGAMSQALGLLGAVPQIYAMCAKKQWATILDRKDPRIAEDIYGKSTLRIYVGTFVSTTRMMEEWGVLEILEKWMSDFSKTVPQIPRKTITVPL